MADHRLPDKVGRYPPLEQDDALSNLYRLHIHLVFLLV